MSKFIHKRGDTFELMVALQATINGVQVSDLTGYSVVSKIRDNKGVLISDLVFAWVDAAQGIGMLSTPSSAAWPLTTAVMDVSLISPAGKRITSDSETFTIKEAQSR